MSAAVFLLEDKEQNIAAIAELPGYSSAGHCSSAFHNYYKISPNDYRKLQLSRIWTMRYLHL